MLSAIRLSSDVVFLGLWLRTGSRLATGCNTSVTVSHKLSAEMSSYLSPVSNEIICAAALLCESAVCFFCKSSLPERTCGFPKRTTRHLTLIWSLRGHMQSHGLGQD